MYLIHVVRIHTDTRSTIISLQQKSETDTTIIKFREYELFQDLKYMTA
jgi:hypothetical protein